MILFLTCIGLAVQGPASIIFSLSLSACQLWNVRCLTLCGVYTWVVSMLVSLVCFNVDYDGKLFIDPLCVDMRF